MEILHVVRLAMLLYKKAENKVVDQTAWMHRLVCTFVVHMQ